MFKFKSSCRKNWYFSCTAALKIRKERVLGNEIWEAMRVLAVSANLISIYRTNQTNLQNCNVAFTTKTFH